MTFEEYQEISQRTAVYPMVGENFIYPAMGLAGEAGEVVGKISKILRDDDGVITEKKRSEISKELGDVLWYIAQVSTEFKLSLEEIAKNNVEKLASRNLRNQLHGDGDNR